MSNLFPYDELPLSAPTTSADIEKYGDQALLRALNIGRVVAFVGSGTSLNFGQPSWDDFRDRASKMFFALENCIIRDFKLWAPDEEEYEPRFQREFRNKLTGLAREIKELAYSEEISPSYFVGLCEAYFESVGPMLQKHGGLSDQVEAAGNLEELKTAARIFSELSDVEEHGRHQPLAWVKYLTGPTILDSDDFQGPPESLSDFRKSFARRFQSLEQAKPAASLEDSNVPENLIKRLAALRKDAPGASIDEFEVRLIEAFANGKTGGLRHPRTLESLLQDLDVTLPSDVHALAKKFDASNEHVENIDVARALRTRAGIRRFLTLNYDLEIERMLLEEGRSAPLDKHEFFRRFVDQNGFDNSEARDYDQGEGRAVSLVSPAGRIVRSTSSRKETLADLFAFGAFPTNFDASVHHLHGRVDDPDNMIITPSDYQKIYYGKREQKKSFDEARHAVFTGSDL